MKIEVTSTGKIIPNIKEEDIWRFTQLQHLYDVDPEGTFILPEMITEGDVEDALNSENGKTKTFGGFYAQDFMGGLILRIEINGKEYSENEKIEDLDLYFNYDDGTLSLANNKYPKYIYYRDDVAEIENLIRCNFSIFWESNAKSFHFVCDINSINVRELDDHEIDLIFHCGKDSMSYNYGHQLINKFLTKVFDDIPDDDYLRKLRKIIASVNDKYFLTTYPQHSGASYFSPTTKSRINTLETSLQAEEIPSVFFNYQNGIALFKVGLLPDVLPKNVWELLRNTKHQRLQLETLKHLRCHLNARNVFAEMGPDVDFFCDYVRYIKSYDTLPS